MLVELFHPFDLRKHSQEGNKLNLDGSTAKFFFCPFAPKRCSNYKIREKHVYLSGRKESVHLTFGCPPLHQIYTDGFEILYNQDRHRER